AASFAETALAATRLVAVAIAVTTHGRDAAVRAVVRTLHQAGISAPVLVGGRRPHPGCRRRARRDARSLNRDPGQMAAPVRRPMPTAMARARTPPTKTRAAARPAGAPPSRAPTTPSTSSPTSVATTVKTIRTDDGARATISSGST